MFSLHQDDNPPDPSFCGDVATLDLSLLNHCDESCCEENLGSIFWFDHRCSYEHYAYTKLYVSPPPDVPSQSRPLAVATGSFAQSKPIAIFTVHIPKNEHKMLSWHRSRSDWAPLLFTVLHCSDQTNSICTQCGILLVHRVCLHTTVISGLGFYESLQWGSLASGCISDIYGGELYQALSSSDGPLIAGNSISFTLNSDGVDYFRSTRESFWPVLLMINELPFNVRWV